MARLLILLMALLFALPALAGPVDINSATVTELDALPGIGPAKAQAIVDHRSQNGPFASIEALTSVSGIGSATLDNLRSLIVVGPSASAGQASPSAKSAPVAAATTPGSVNINTATALQLQSLPGIGATKAQAIVDDREANGPFASCDDLTRVAGVGPATLASIADVCLVQGLD